VGLGANRVLTVIKKLLTVGERGECTKGRTAALPGSLDSSAEYAFNRPMSDGHIVFYRFARIVAGIALALAVVWAHHFLPSSTSALAAEASRSLHAPGFGLVSIIVLKLGRFRGAPSARFLKAASLTMLLAVLAEASQLLAGSRAAQLTDLISDALGIIGFLGFAAVLDRDVRGAVGIPGTTVFALGSIAAIAAAIAPTAWLTYALIMRQQSLPQLLTFEGSWERAFARGELADFEVIPAPDGWPEGSGNIARLESSGRFAMMLHLAPYPDWSNHVAMSFVAATTDGEPRRIELGLWGLRPANGSLPGRYYTGVRIGPIPARYCLQFKDLPNETSDRPFNLEIISELLLAAAKHEAGVNVLVDDFRLEDSTENCSNK
jgi:VanZ family protein